MPAYSGTNPKGVISVVYRYSLLGPVRVWSGDREVDPGSPQQCAVLALLLLA
ncbi:MAG: hypothetical protein QOF99_3912, partial [Pseudonocardiales bacterium]|nr:hypothetical protein [Pseudonocardiales bacterium]